MNLERENTSSNKYLVILSILAFVISQANYIIGIVLLLICIIVLVMTHEEVVLNKSFLPIVIMIVVGFVGSMVNLNSLVTLNIIKDISYFMRPVVIMYFGYIVSYYNKSNNRSDIYKFTVLYSAFSAMYNLGNILINLKFIVTNFSFLNIREVMGHSDDITVLGFVVLIFYNQYYGKKLFSHNIANLFTMIFIINLLISFSRTKILTFCIMLIIFTVMSPKKNIKLKNIIISLLILILVIAGILYIVYGDAYKYFSFLVPFINKMKNSLTEISTQSDWNNYAEIVHNWRGYEMYSAKQLIGTFTNIKKLFGAGLGTLVPVSHSDLVGVPLSEGGIILLHNGYYTILIKTGIVGLMLYLSFFTLSIIKGVKCLKKDRFYTAILVSICIEILMNSYTTTGIIKSVYSFGMLIVLGYMMWRVEYENNKKI
ncbi:O-antigen ligase family protein [Latilactobacillus sakei]|uniref:O-antigen ligase family protein n=1 Tax=Latilactobacillus sakei TaxID=1599 RepID=UPI000978E8AC|nr:O-antigen ligase family protein [Latilactobacillus sakei]